ncbi:Reverse transcriptase domain [Trinorchestia longiramus]|nr:Reverse transcriptase domain [Trinorchestia longiramus]
MSTNSLLQHVNKPTRGNNILNLVMTTPDLSINGLEITDKIGDHQMIDFSLEVQDPNTRTEHKQALNYKRANFELMKEELGSYNYEVLMSNKNAEECYMILKGKIATATEHHIPRKQVRPTNNPPCFSQEIKCLINARHSYRRLKRYQTEPHRQEHIHALEEVAKELSILNPYKSTGPDGFGPRILKETAEVISEPLTNIFNRSLETGIAPEDWKRANVTPIFKKGNKQIPNNNRPISLTSVISKIIERLLKVRITEYLNDQNLITDTQHRFREKRICLTNILDFFGEVNRIYDCTKAVDLVYLDFQKTFDKVPHERLMAKVEAHRIRGNYSRWTQNWLTSRTQRVVIHDETSDSTFVTSGVPQGSVLGPRLFIIYINDLDVGIISKINKFDDNTKLCHRAFTKRNKATIQSDLNRFLQWTKTWQMSFNIDKCSVMHVGANNRHFQRTMCHVPFETVQQQRDLSVIVTENLKPDKQVEKSVKNASRILGFIAQNFEYKSKNIILPLYT